MHDLLSNNFIKVLLQTICFKFDTITVDCMRLDRTQGEREREQESKPIRTIFETRRHTFGHDIEVKLANYTLFLLQQRITT